MIAQINMKTYVGVRIMFELFIVTLLKLLLNFGKKTTTMYFKDFRHLYRVSNNGPTSQKQAAVYEIFVFSDQECSNEIIPTYVNESGHSSGLDDKYVYSNGSAAFDKNSNTYWRAQCETCHKNEAWITFVTTESASCVRAPNLGMLHEYSCFGINCYDTGINVELKMDNGLWKSVMASDTGNQAKLGKAIYLYYLLTWLN